VADESLLSDDLLRQLVATGHVDILVGVPTLNNASTVVDVVRAAQGGLAKYFPRARALIFNADSGSDDGTPTLVRDATTDDTGTVSASRPLRTTNRISTPYHGLPGKGSAMRMIFAVADLLSADAVVTLDPNVTSVTPDWIPALASPVLDGHADLVAPWYPRATADAPLVTQLVRPLVRAAYGWTLYEPLMGEFGCSRPFATHCLDVPAGSAGVMPDGVDLWMAVEALARGFRPAQAAIGPRLIGASRKRPALPEVFQQVMDAVYACLELHDGYWPARGHADAVPCFGTLRGALESGPRPDVSGMAEAFARDVAALQPVLQTILSEATLAGVMAAAATPSRLSYDDELWAATVFEFLLAYRRAVITREHITLTLLPLYLGRTAAFLLQHASSGPATVEAALESLCLAFERAKPAAAAQWKKP
jgi:glucosylglycerate synthase